MVASLIKKSPQLELSRTTPVVPKTTSTIPADSIRPTAVHFEPLVRVSLPHPKLHHHRHEGVKDPHKKNFGFSPLPSPGPSILASKQTQLIAYPIYRWGLHDKSPSDYGFDSSCSLAKRWYKYPTNLHCFIPTTSKNHEGRQYDPIGTTEWREDTTTPYKEVNVIMPEPDTNLKAVKKLREGETLERINKPPKKVRKKSKNPNGRLIKLIMASKFLIDLHLTRMKLKLEVLIVMLKKLLELVIEKMGWKGVKLIKKD